MAHLNILHFIDAIKNIGFYVEVSQPNTFEIRNRSVASDDDCSDHPRDTEFYEYYSDKYKKWADRKIKDVTDLANTYRVKVAFETDASEYGILWVVIL